uniref:Apple domain-containing protein n=1 Tax=Globodera pallida TaxID=36090 RepID=A0A183CQC6_GLOPA
MSPESRRVRCPKTFNGDIQQFGPKGSQLIQGKSSDNDQFACTRDGFGLFGKVSWLNDGKAEQKGQWPSKWAKWLSVEVNAPTVADCVRQCYEYRFCYSILYEFKSRGTFPKRKQCRMFLHAADTCRGMQLTPISR